ncbi:hypothetical protein SAMN04515671_3545 [Nakamurella panacisegetis]|uniref:Uncharacterized protein n=1 Tax=Nakamurella panacisegetis TaxID=1090615 RepID=A0A1H0RFV6_9ACTN|nr:hypothetical protein [Nakamurella panacisegetis]SDP28270.1 hypothetical protein SAMN04515671_3545 [Nakamurella panacisegetis]
MTSSQDFGTYPPAGQNPIAGAYATPPPSTYDLNPSHSRATSSSDEPSTTDVAKDQAANVAGSAGEAAQQVAGVAKEQVQQVTAEATRQAKHMLYQAQSELSDQAQVQQEKLADGLHAVGDQLKSMAQGSDQPGVATDLAHQAADKAHEIAGWLEGRKPGDVLNEVRSFARQRPGMFLAVALGAGLVAGRLARGLAADPDELGNSVGTAPKAPALPRQPGYVARPAVGGVQPSALSAGGAHSSPDGTDLYGTGAVPDWTGKSVEDLREGR